MSTTIEALLDLDSLLTPEDLELRAMVRQFGEQGLRPHVAEWFDTGEVPVRDLAVEIGKLGLPACIWRATAVAGRRPPRTAWCASSRPSDSGLRSLVSVRGSLAMFAIHHWGRGAARSVAARHGRG